MRSRAKIRSLGKKIALVRFSSFEMQQIFMIQRARQWRALGIGPFLLVYREREAK